MVGDNSLAVLAKAGDVNNSLASNGVGNNFSAVVGSTSANAGGMINSLTFNVGDASLWTTWTILWLSMLETRVIHWL